MLVILVAIAVTAAGAYGNYLLEQKFDPAWFVPGDSYVGRWFQKNRELFPFGGDRVTVFMHGLDYPGDLERVDKLVRTLENQVGLLKVNLRCFLLYVFADLISYCRLT